MTAAPHPNLDQEISRLRSSSARERGHGAETLAPWLKKMIYPLLRHLTNNAGDARELTVTVVGQLIFKLGLGLYRRQEGANFQAWAFTVARNEWRQWKRGQEETISLESLGCEFAAPAVVEEEDSAERIAAREALHEALATLPEQDRRLLELRFFQGGLNHREIGEALGISTGNARVRSLRVLRGLRERLSRDARLQAWGLTLSRDQTTKPQPQTNHTMHDQESVTATK